MTNRICPGCKTQLITAKRYTSTWDIDPEDIKRLELDWLEEVEGVWVALEGVEGEVVSGFNSISEPFESTRS